MKLTKSVVESAVLPTKGQVFIWDEETRGFGVRLTPTAKTYIVQGRVKGVDRRVSIGRHGVLTVQEARKKAQSELAKMDAGIDPAVEKKRAEAYSLTLKQLAEKYIEKRRELKPSSIADINKHIKTSFASWADHPATEITRDKVATKFTELTDRSPAQANQAMRILRALLNFARGEYRPGDKPIIVENPVAILSDTKVWNRVKSRSGRIPTDKIGIAWNVLQTLREDPAQSVVGRTLADAVSFLLLTGCRWSEMACLSWENVNLDESWWHIPDPKNREAVTFPLSKVAAEILTARKQKSGYVFPSRIREGKDHIKDARSVIDAVSEAVGVRISPHDLRRTFRAIAGKCGIELWKTKLLMNHKMSGDVTIKHYTETSDLRDLSTEINAIGDWIVRQGIIAKTNNVVQLPTKANTGGNER